MTEVCKSTLINTVFGKKFAQTVQGKSNTQQIEKYESNNLRIFDTKCLELKDYKQNLQDIENFFKRAASKRD